MTEQDKSRKQYRELAVEYLAWCIALRKDFETVDFHHQFMEFMGQMYIHHMWSDSQIDGILHEYYAYIMPVFRKRMARGEGMGAKFGKLVVNAAEANGSTEFFE